jgi:triosephosphate isomerase (TIM)
MRPLIIAGNWKMHGDPESSEALARTIAHDEIIAPFSAANGTVVLCPTFLDIHRVVSATVATEVQVGAQDCHHEEHGAFTGNVSAEMLAQNGCAWVIVGHSERRRDHAETDEVIGKKTRSAIDAGLLPIVCIGELEEERRSGVTLDVLQGQLEVIINACGSDAFHAAVIAYEPVWAIGTGLAATPEMAQEAHAFIKKVCREVTGADLAVLYGGSVKPDNAEELFGQPDINGALVGGASLNAADFITIISSAYRVVRP